MYVHSESGTGKHSFFVIRSIFKQPYAVLHIAFLYNIPGRVRSNVGGNFIKSLSRSERFSQNYFEVSVQFLQNFHKITL